MFDDFTLAEIIRIICYTIAPIAALYVAIGRWHTGLRHEAAFYATLVILFVWYAIEISMTAHGIVTREYRVIATPIMTLLTLLLVAIAFLESKKRAR